MRGPVTIEISSPGWRTLMPLSSGMRNRSASTDGMATRTDPERVDPGRAPASSAAACSPIGPTRSRAARPLPFSTKPLGRRSKSSWPSAPSRLAMRLATVACVTSIARAVADKVPCLARAAKKRRSSQSSFGGRGRCIMLPPAEGTGPV